MNLIKLKFLSVVLICICISCSQEESSKRDVETPGFEIVKSAHSNIDFVNKLSDDPLAPRNILSNEYYYNGAGVAVADFNNDGLEDIFLAGNEVKNEIYINKGDFVFEKLPDNSGINENKVWASGVSIIDINNDGYEDVYVCQHGPYSRSDRKNLFYINNGNLTFTERAAEMGLDDPNYSTQAVFLDYDKDGDLDCYVLNESQYAQVILKTVYEQLKEEKNMRIASGKLFENLGNLKFKDVTKEAGVLNYGYGLGVSVSDLNNDSWPDIYVANDYAVPDFLYINQKDGTFKEEIKSYTKQISYFSMGCDIADINNDALPDIGIVDMAAEDHFRDKTLMASMNVEAFKYYFTTRDYHLQYMFNSLQLNNGNGTFSNIASLAGVLKSDWSWAAIFADFNLDGYKDYYVSNGYRRYSRDNDFRNEMKRLREENNGTIPRHLREDVYYMMPEIKLKNKLYINDGKLHFNDNSPLFTHPDYESYSYGVAQADFDNDGDIDLIVNNVDQEAMLLKNTTRETTSKNYLQLILDADDQTIELNSKVYLQYGDNVQFQEYYFVRGYCSTMQQCLFFGLDDAESIDRIKVVWSDGNVQYIDNVNANQRLTINYEKTNLKNEEQIEDSYFTQVSAIDLGIDFKHEENEFDDFEKEILLPQRQTAFGPAIETGDINNDGLDDLYIGGAKGQAGALYVQNERGQFDKIDSQNLANEFYSEDVDAAFVDVNKDGNKDLFVLSGGSGDYQGLEDLLQDRFYAGNGKGEYFRIANALPEYKYASYAIIPEDIDNNSSTDLLILGAAKPGQYPMKEPSILLKNINNKYEDVTADLIPELNSADGLIRDACWADLNNDGFKDLITVGEWQNVEVYLYQNGQYSKQSESWKTNKKFGWWRSIQSADLDGDGDLDFIVGNVGKNFKQKATDDYPLYLYSNDFDDNGTLDCVLAKPYKDKIVPARGKECSTEQMPFVSEKFTTYKDFATASVVDIYGESKLNDGISLKANDFYSYILWNEGSYFEFEKLPVLAQSFPLNAIEIIDVNNDAKPDLLLAGNDYNTEYETPRLDAGYGLVLINEGERSFDVLTTSESGVYVSGDVKRMSQLTIGNQKAVIVANNNDYPDILLLNK